jgi:hypothetical protein
MVVTLPSLVHRLWESGIDVPTREPRLIWMRRSPVSWQVFLILVAVGILAWWATGASPLAVVVAVVAGTLIMKVGYSLLAGFGAPVPEPPPPGELRKVRLQYRCSICGTEVRMTAANDEVPTPPRHCQEDMDLVAPLYE